MNWKPGQINFFRDQVVLVQRDVELKEVPSASGDRKRKFTQLGSDSNLEKTKRCVKRKTAKRKMSKNKKFGRKRRK